MNHLKPIVKTCLSILLSINTRAVSIKESTSYPYISIFYLYCVDYYGYGFEMLFKLSMVENFSSLIYRFIILS
jgi:hypothetical protein